jgi:hypothetical protein
MRGTLFRKRWKVALCMPLSLNNNNKQLEIFTIVFPTDHTYPCTTDDLEENTNAAYYRHHTLDFKMQCAAHYQLV